MAPLAPLNEARVVMVPLPAASSKTVPRLLAPPPARRAVEVALRVEDQAADRMAPLAPLNEARVVMVLTAGGQLEDRAQPKWPRRLSVAPKRLPCASCTRLPSGLVPLAPLNEARVVMVLLPAASSKTVPALVLNQPPDVVP